MDIIKKFEPIFGEWYAESFIGAGSFGRVYKIYREELGERFYSALKYYSIPADGSELTQLKLDGMSDESISVYYTELARDIVKEAQTMSRLKGNTNIVAFEDSKVLPKPDGIGYDVFIRMELLTSLTTHMLEHTMTEDEVKRLGTDICSAMEICENYGIIHRDIKPDNLFVNEMGKFKLGDFGIARQLEKTATFMSKKGTYSYMAPEVYKGEKYGATADIYSLGMVMYRLLNGGRLPFFPPAPQPIRAIDREAAILKRMSGAEIPMPRDGGTTLGGIVLKACSFNPKDRYQSAKDMKAALESLAHSPAVNEPTATPVFAPEPTAEPVFAVTPEPTAPPTAQSEPEAPTEQVDKTLGLWGKDIYGNPTTPPNPTPEQKPAPEPVAVPTPEKRRKRTPLIAALLLVATIVAAVILILTTRSKTTEPAESLAVPPSTMPAVQTATPTPTPTATPTPTPTATPTPTPYQEVYGEWSEWSTDEVDTTDTRQVESRTEYRYMDKTTKTVTETLSDWTLENTETVWGDYGAWSNWSISSVTTTEARQVESKKQYRYRTVTVTQQLSDWSEWSKWSTTAVTAESNCEVETRTTYHYYYYTCANCGKHWHGYAFVCYTEHGGCGFNMSYPNGVTVLWLDIPYTNSGITSYWAGSYYLDTSYGRVYTKKDQSRTEYRSRTRTLQDVVSYSAWSSWGDTAYTATATREVENRTVYRYRTRAQITYYTYSKWSSWSSWSANKVNESSTRRVETRTLYRYRDKKG
ncbi:MAG: protein kinase [Clostridia bacterium]|nr:protein kinase [Clostridia bacterium]